MRLTDDQLDELEAAARRATEGAWAQSLDPDHWAVIYGRGGACICTLNAWVDALDEAQANARHVAAADPATVLALVAEVRVARVYENTVLAWVARKQEESEDG